jgi:predicted DNA-binding transcriptional regulator YafY
LRVIVAQAAAETASPPDADDWVRVVIPIEAVDQAATDLMWLGADAEVLEPLELRCRIAECAHDPLRLYRGRP